MSETSKVSLKVSGKKFAFPADAAHAGWKCETRPGGWVIATSPEGERIRLAGQEFRGKLGFVFTRTESSSSGSAYGEIIAKNHRTPHGAGAGATVSVDAELTALFPGKVRKILVAAGTRVQAGDPLLLVEAMKMEFAVKAPVSGRVSALRVKEGQQLQPGDRFVDFEPGIDSEKD